MAGSVAGQIRIDLMANAASFNAGMRDAGREGFGTFQTEAQKFDRWFQSRKETAKRESGRADAWQTAMGGAGGPMNSPGAYSLDMRGGSNTGTIAFQNAMRMKDALPWGTSMRTTMSREAMLTAAAIGEHKQTLIKNLSGAAKDIAGKAAEAGGLGGILGTVGKFAAGHPLATGVGLAAVAVANQMRERDALAREIKRDSLTLGQGAEDTSRMHAVGLDQPTLSKFQRSLSQQTAEGTSALSQMGLNAEGLAGKPLINALTDVSAGLDNIKNPADKANAAMALFGKSGAEMIATLSNLKGKMDAVGEHDIIRAADIERTAAWDKALKGVKNSLGEATLGLGRLVGMESGIGTHFARTGEMIGTLVKGAFAGNMSAYDKSKSRWDKEDYNIAHADEIEKARIAQAKLANDAERYAAGMQKSRDTLKGLSDKLLDLRQGDGASARQDFQREIEKTWAAGGKKPGEVQRQMEQYDAFQAQIKADQDKKKGEELYKSAVTSSPEGRYQEATKEIDYLFNYGRMQEDQYQTLKLKYLRDYYREAEGLDADAIRKRLTSGHREYQQGMANLRAHGGAAGLSGQEVDAEAARRTQDERKRLGISDPLGDFGRDYLEHRSALSDGTMTPKEFQRWLSGRKKSAAGELVGDQPDIRLNAAMTSGSSEAHSLIARAATADPKTKAALDSASALDRIVKLLESGQNVSEEMLRAMKDAII